MTALVPTPIRTVLIYAQDTRGLGHVTRSVTIARHLLEADPYVVVHLVTRSRVVGSFELPRGCDYIKLPSRKTPRALELPPETDEALKEHFRQLRGRILTDVALGLAPNLVLVDHEPLGSSGEFREGLWALKRRYPATRFVFGLRDIMDDPERIRADWRDMGVYEALECLYDGIAVFGSPRLYDVADAYAIPESVHPKLEYCGYVVRDAPPAVDPAALRRQQGLPAEGPLVLATVGSGRDGFPILEAAVTAIRRLQEERADLSAIVVTGPLMASEEQDALLARSTPRCRVVTQADTFELMAAADALVSMGGYNTLCEGLFMELPLVVVPRSTHKVEQQIRTELLADRGLARWVHPGDLGDGAKLVDALRWSLARDREDHRRRVREVFPSFDGATRTCAYLSRFLTNGD